ncbi:MAG: YihY/virulence factor BrkB family protein [Thermoanaerobaculaceae bacterium]
MGKEWATTLLRRVAQQRLTLYAAALAYTTLLALVPTATVVFVMAAKVDPQGATELIKRLAQFFPYSPAQVQDSLLLFARRLTTLGGIAVLLAFLSALAALLQIEQAFIAMVGSSPRRRWLRLGSFLSSLVVGPLVLLGVLSLHTLLAYSGPFSSWLPVQVFWQPLGLCAGLTLLYRFFPPTSMSWGAAGVGAAVATAAEQGLVEVVKLYLRFFPQLSLVYGPLSLLLVFLISLMLFWLVVLGGAEVAFLLQERRSRSFKV